MTDDSSSIVVASGRLSGGMAASAAMRTVASLSCSAPRTAWATSVVDASRRARAARRCGHPSSAPTAPCVQQGRAASMHAQAADRVGERHLQRCAAAGEERLRRASPARRARMAESRCIGPMVRAVDAIEDRRLRPHAEHGDRLGTHLVVAGGAAGVPCDALRRLGGADAQVGVDRAPDERLAGEPALERGSQLRERALDAAIVVDRARGLGDDNSSWSARKRATPASFRRRSATTAARRTPRDGLVESADDRVRGADARERERAGVPEVHVLVVVRREHRHDRLDRRPVSDAAERLGGEESHARRRIAEQSGSASTQPRRSEDRPAASRPARGSPRHRP